MRIDWCREGKAHTNISGLNHADVVTAIPYTANALLGEFADQASDVSLLCRRASAGNDGRELRRDLNELILEHVETQLTNDH